MRSQARKLESSLCCSLPPFSFTSGLFPFSPPLSLSKDWLPLLTRSSCSSTMSAGTYLDDSGAKSGQESTGQCQRQHSPSLKPGPQCQFSGGRVPLTDSTCLGMSYPWAGVLPASHLSCTCTGEVIEESEVVWLYEYHFQGSGHRMLSYRDWM